MSRSVACLLCAAAALAMGGCAASTSATESAHAVPSGPGRSGEISAAARRPHPSPRTFVSLVPACACGRHTELELFSASSGRMLRRLAAVSLGGYEQLSTPAAANDGRLYFTFTSGAQCAASGAYAECPTFVPASCRNAVNVLSPGQTQSRLLFTVPGSAAIRQAVPSPDGGEVAMMITPCLSLHGTTGLFVRDLKTGITRAIATASDTCDTFGPAAWNRAGTELVFPLERADGPPVAIAGGVACPDGRHYLALAPAHTARKTGRLKLIDPDRGCMFVAAAFDRAGIVAAEGCQRGDPQHGVGSYLGDAFVARAPATF